MGKQNPSTAPAPPNYTGAAEKMGQQSQASVNAQTQANRPNQSNPWGSSEWNQGANGQWTQTTSLNGQDQQRLDAQRAQQMGIYGKTNDLMGQMDTGPLDFSGLSKLDSGGAARDQAINAAYGQATSRLDPQWQTRENQARNELANQGLDPSSEAYQNQMGMLGRQRNDAYSSAMNGAIGQGTQAGSALFNQSLAGRQQGMAELLRQREMPYQEFGQMFGSQQGVGNPQFNQFNAAGMAQTPNWLGAAGMGGEYGLGSTQANNAGVAASNENMGSLVSGGGAAAAGILAALASFF